MYRMSGIADEVASSMTAVQKLSFTNALAKKFRLMKFIPTSFFISRVQFSILHIRRKHQIAGDATLFFFFISAISFIYLKRNFCLKKKRKQSF